MKIFVRRVGSWLLAIMHLLRGHGSLLMLPYCFIAIASYMHDYSFLLLFLARVIGGSRGVAKGAVAPPFLLSQEIQNNECIDIKTQ